MYSKRSSVLAVACALLLPAAACGGSSDSNGNDTVTPEGTHYSYVVSKVFVPTNTATSTEYGLDLGSTKSGTPDGTVDNKLGGLLTLLNSSGFKLQATIDTAVDQGKILLLVDFQTKDFTNASAAGLSVKLGGTATPAPCSSATDTTCRHHLDGNATITVAANSPSDALVAGKIASGTFNGGPGDLSLQIALGSTDPITLNLVNARAKATAITDAGLTANIGGALLVSEINSQLIPVVQRTLAGILDADCGVPRKGPAPDCGCTGTTSPLILSFFDTSPKDCQVTSEEIANAQLVKTSLAPDVCSTDKCAAADAVSVGIKIQTVKATIQ
jgi:hypothetical protein